MLVELDGDRLSLIQKEIAKVKKAIQVEKGAIKDCDGLVDTDYHSEQETKQVVKECEETVKKLEKKLEILNLKEQILIANMGQPVSRKGIEKEIKEIAGKIDERKAQLKKFADQQLSPDLNRAEVLKIANRIRACENDIKDFEKQLELLFLQMHTFGAEIGRGGVTRTTK